MDKADIRQRFEAALTEIIESCRITEDFIDKDRFRVYIATVWGNAVLDPEQTGITEADLPALHDYLNEEIVALLGKGQSITSCYEHLCSKTGEESMVRLQINAQHKEFIHHFARLILGADALSNINLREE